MSIPDRIALAWRLYRLATTAMAGSAMILTDSSSPAADVPAISAGRAALGGFWHIAGASMGGGERLGLPRAGPALDAMLPKLQPWAAAEHANDVAAQAAGEYRPTAQMKCFPEHVPGTGLPQFSMNIGLMIERRQVTFLYEVNHIVRIAYLDQNHPAHLAPGWLGHSVARWDGDTLVVDTIGFNDQMHLDRGVPMTAKMHIVQRLRIVDGRLEIQAVFNDPGTFTGPVTVTNSYNRAEPFQEYICQENNQEGGVPTATGTPTKPLLQVNTPKVK